MKILLLFAFLSCFINIGCRILPSNSCDISEADALKILQSPKVFRLMRSDPRLQLPDDKKNSPYIRTCGYVTEKNLDYPFLHWYDVVYEVEQKASEYINQNTREKPPRREADHLGFSFDELSGIGNEAFLEQEDFGDSKRISIIGRKGRTIFLMRIQSDKLSETSVEDLKILTKKVVDETL